MKLDLRRTLLSLATAGTLALTPSAVTVASEAHDAASTAEARPYGAPGLPVLDATLASSATVRQTGTGNPDNDNDTMPTPTGTGTQMTSDQQFLTMAASGSATEVLAGQLAQQRATNADVRALGARIAEDHARALQQVMNLAKSKGLTAPQAPSTTAQANLIEDLSRRSGDDFDHAFVRAMADEHRTTIANFENARVSLSSDIGSFVAQQLPTLREHLEMSQRLDTRVSGGSQ
ncbi:MAG: DUF4142 domain-containing protein [Chloroflexota bacterium]